MHFDISSITLCFFLNNPTQSRNRDRCHLDISSITLFFFVLWTNPHNHETETGVTWTSRQSHYPSFFFLNKPTHPRNKDRCPQGLQAYAPKKQTQGRIELLRGVWTGGTVGTDRLDAWTRPPQLRNIDSWQWGHRPWLLATNRFEARRPRVHRNLKNYEIAKLLIANGIHT